MFEYIQGEKFKTLENNKNIFYCDTHEVNNFLVNSNIEEDFVLISHNSDGKIIDNGKLFPHADPKCIPKNLKKWYAQNVCIEHPKIESIPIGLENSKWFVYLEKNKKLQEKIQTEKRHKNLLYINHNISTNPKERLEPYILFNDKSFATCVQGMNGFNFDSYIDNIYNHKFVICPEGNGTDTHRTWECLYLNTIPIEKRNINNQFYKDLPICFVDSWNQITEEFLENEYIRISNIVYNKEKLDFNYWKNKILN